ncbi:alpha/beta hydrolase [Kitasatospora sp. RG8]|uniref:lipase family alpha/beta hydrolase n=1 Tax=Kitasatospora sp. RG8 TaxID=2820815 RepID=UPI001AE0D9FF|nr:alpha/beta fold hydrolase [Kitasatospora sp. RG8]MBP0448134.1 alpha/beta hydrolase [Kitasatospora sp. RG8]
MEKLPIIYVRGYAMRQSDIDAAVDDPFYGFNLGAVHYRMGGDGDPDFHQFESPLLRLMIDEQYELFVEGDQHRYLKNAEDRKVKPNSLWVFRFYDQSATTFKPRRDPVEFNIEEAAADLYDFIILIRRKTGADKVYLVAHSMGGLIVRCMMQKICFLPDTYRGGRRPSLPSRLVKPTATRLKKIAQRVKPGRRHSETEPATPSGHKRQEAKKLVEKFFTYGTPHGGISTRVSGSKKFQELFGVYGSDIFVPGLMYGYLDRGAKFGDKAPRRWDPQEIPEDVFPADKMFCLVGTDWKDYEAALGFSRHLVGSGSDGLVLMDRAFIRRSPKAYVYKSHSGRYGLVNSEEGYQNLRRFLFGRWGIQVELGGLTPTPSGPKGSKWQVNVRLAIRGLSIVMSERWSEHGCPISLSKESTESGSVSLVSTFLYDMDAIARENSTGGSGKKKSHDGLMRYALSLHVFKLNEPKGAFCLDDHLEQVPDWGDWLIVDMKPLGDRTNLESWCAWKSMREGEIDHLDLVADAPLEHTRQKDGSQALIIKLPHAARALPAIGENAHLKISVYDRMKDKSGAPHAETIVTNNRMKGGGREPEEGGSRSVSRGWDFIRRRKWLFFGLGILSIGIGVGVGVGIAVSPRLTAPAETGPEGISLESGSELAPAGAAAGGPIVDGLSCSVAGHAAYRIQSHLAVYVNGRPRSVPAGVGVVTPIPVSTPSGTYVKASNCSYQLNTRVSDGVIHVDSPTQTGYTLGQFFDVWRQPLSATRVGPAIGPVSAYVNGKAYAGNPRNIALQQYEEIQLNVGADDTAPKPVDWSHFQAVDGHE